MTYDHWKTTEPDYGTRGTEREEEYRDEIDRLCALCAAQKDEIDSLRASRAALLAAAKAVVADFRFHWPGTLLKAPLEDLGAAIAAAEEPAP